MGNAIFGKPKEEPRPVVEPPSIQDQLTILEKRKNHLGKLIEINDKKAKESKTKNEAAHYIKIRVRYENELKSVYGMVEKLENLEHATQQAMFQKDVLNTVKHNTTIIKNNTVDVADAEEIMDNVKEAVDEANEVSNVLARPTTPDADVEAEVDKLFQQEKPTILNLPDVPRVVPKPEDPVEKELRTLVGAS